MLLKKILDKAMEMADSAEVHMTRSESSTISFENSMIKESSSSDLGGVSLRVIKDGKIGFSSSSKPNDDSVADFALQVSKQGKNVEFSFNGSSDAKPFELETGDFDKLTEEYLISESEGVIDNLKSVHDEALAACSIQKNVSESKIMSSIGLDTGQKTKSISWYCGLKHNTEGNFLHVYDFKTGDTFTGFNEIVANVKEDFEICQNNVTIEPGKYKVLFSPRGMMYLISVFTSCLSGLAVAKGISPWGDRTGEKLFDERISVRSNLVLDDASLRLAFDDEGTPTGITEFIEKGMLKSFYHSLDSAAQTKQTLTGHGFKGSFASLPGASAFGIEIAPGESSVDDMMEDADIWVDDIIGAIMSNPYAGIISGNPSMSFTLEDGKKTAHIKDFMLSINVFDLFKNGIIAISKDVKQVGMPPFFPTFKAPYILVDGVSITSK
ncbi:MAG: TldD/PmbA family protein [bacterium]